MPITDGWFNVFRLSDDEPVQAADAFLEPGDRLFGGGGGEAWLSVTLDQGLGNSGSKLTSIRSSMPALPPANPRDSDPPGSTTPSAAARSRASRS